MLRKEALAIHSHGTSTARNGSFGVPPLGKAPSNSANFEPFRTALVRLYPVIPAMA